MEFSAADFVFSYDQVINDYAQIIWIILNFAFYMNLASYGFLSNLVKKCLYNFMVAVIA